MAQGQSWDCESSNQGLPGAKGAPSEHRRPQRPGWKGPGKPGSEIGKGCVHFKERKGEGQGLNPARLILTVLSLTFLPFIL